MMHGKKFVAGGESEEADTMTAEQRGSALACKQAGGIAGMGKWAFSCGQIENGNQRYDTASEMQLLCLEKSL